MPEWSAEGVRLRSLLVEAADTHSRIGSAYLGEMRVFKHSRDLEKAYVPEWLAG